jgi:hypothetical protein
MIGFAARRVVFGETVDVWIDGLDFDHELPSPVSAAKPEPLPLRLLFLNPNLLSYLRRIGARTAQLRAMAQGDPDLETP